MQPAAGSPPRSRHGKFIEGFPVTFAPAEGTVELDPVLPVYPPGTQLTLTFTPNPGHSFASWGGDLDSTSNPLTITVDQPLNLVVNTHAPPQGEHLWTFTAAAQSGTGDDFSEMAIDDEGNILVSYAPVRDGGSGVLYCLRPDGTVKWSKPVSNKHSAPPVIASDGTIYLAGHGRLYAFDKDGNENWSRFFSPTDPRVQVAWLYPPALTSDDRIFFGYEESFLRLDPANGSTLWQLSTAVTHCREISIDSNDHVYFLSWNSGFWKFNSSGGTIWERGGPDNPTDFYPPAIDHAGNLYYTTGSLHGPQRINIRAANSGASIALLQTYDYVSIPPVIDRDGSFYFGSRMGQLTALTATHLEKWNRPGMQDGPVVLAEDGTLYAASNDFQRPRIYALDTADGSVLWESAVVVDPSGTAPSYPYGGAPATPLVKFAIGRNGVLYAASRNGRIYAFQGTAPLSTSTWPKPFGSYRNQARVVPHRPSITAQPQHRNVIAGTTLTIPLEFNARPAATAQWYRDGEAVSGGSQGALTIGNVHPDQAGMYHAVITNSEGSVESNRVRVEVEIRLILQTTGAGVVTATPDVPSFLPGETAQVTVTADPGYQFVGWEGDAGGNDNPLTVVLDTSKTIRAVFRDVESPAIQFGHPDLIESPSEHFDLSFSVSDNIGVDEARVYRDGSYLGRANIDEHGTATFAGILLAFGENHIRVVVSDVEGNETESSFTAVWEPARLLSIDTPDIAPEGQILEAPVLLRSLGNTGGANFEISYDPLYFRSVEFTLSERLAGFNSVHLDDRGVVRVSFAFVGTALPAGEIELGTLRMRVGSLPEAVTTPLGLTLLSIANPFGALHADGSYALGAACELEPRAHTGDINNNGSIDVGDAAQMQRLLTGAAETRPWDAALNDLNGSGGFDIGDIIYALATAAGIHAQPSTGAPRKASRPPVEVTLERPHVRVVADAQQPPPGTRVTVRIVLDRTPARISGASFILDYPPSALHLEDSSSHQPGALVPPTALSIWNLEPSQSDYLAQTGTIHFATSDAADWSGSLAGGELATFSFTVQPGAAELPFYVVRVRSVELPVEAGFEILRPLDATVSLLGVPSSYQAWTTQHFAPTQLGQPEVVDPERDPDRDGLTNLEEFFHGTRPLQTDAGEQFCPVLLESEGGVRYLGIEYAHDVRALGVTTRLQRSSNLLEWTDITGVELSAATDPATGLRRVLFASPDPLGAATAEFWRLHLQFDADP